MTCRGRLHAQSSDDLARAVQRHANLLAITLTRLAALPQGDLPRLLRAAVQWTGTTLRRCLPPQPQADAQRAAGRAEEHRLDLRQHQRRRLCQLSAAALRRHARPASRAPKCLHPAARSARPSSACAHSPRLPPHTKAAQHRGSPRPSAADAARSRSIRSTTLSISGS